MYRCETQTCWIYLLPNKEKDFLVILRDVDVSRFIMFDYSCDYLTLNILTFELKTKSTPKPWGFTHIFLSVVLSHRCLVHILKDNKVRYSKVRPLTPHCQLDLCRHEVRYGCVREDECFYAHSLIELKVWMMQHKLGKKNVVWIRVFFTLW